MTESELREQVKRFRVVYEVNKAERIVDGERRAIGFDLTLCGTPREDESPSYPGSPESGEVWRALQQVAQAIAPTGERASWYSIREFDHALHMAPARDLRSDVELVIEIRHEEGYLEAIDRSERACLDEMRRKLETLGVHEGRW